MAGTVHDIAAAIQTWEPKVVFIDGAYLLRNDKSRDRFQKVADNMDLIKTVALDFAIPVACSFQLNREAAKSKKEPALHQIGYSDAIGQHSSMVIALGKIAHLMDFAGTFA